MDFIYLEDIGNTFLWNLCNYYQSTMLSIPVLVAVRTYES